MKALVVGASGVVGYAAVKQFAGDPRWQVVGASRRIPTDIDDAAFVSVDLLDPEACRAAIEEHRDVTHLVYAALFEKPGLVAGWRERDQMEINLAMFRNILDPLTDPRRGAGARRCSFRARRRTAVTSRRWPCPEKSARRVIRTRTSTSSRRTTSWPGSKEARLGMDVLRPQVIVGESLGSNMNLIPAIGAYGAVLREAGEPLHFPGGAPSVSEVVSADLVARAIAWAATSRNARDEVFNVTNGDVLVWREAWPRIAEALGMEPGEDRPMSLASEMPRREREWAAVVDRYGLRAPRSLD